MSQIYIKVEKKAKKDGDEAMSYIYKILMNSLYRRFGINRESTISEICNEERYQELMKKDNFIYGNKLNDYFYIVSYILNRGVEDYEWMPPNIVAVQLSAAIIACACIHMYKYVSRSDCYYTDTDSAVLGNKLPDDVVSSNEIGMFKLEYKIKRAIFLAPKSYMLELEDDNKIIKHKGPAKDLVSLVWFDDILSDIYKKEKITKSSSFKINWNNLNIMKIETQINLGLPSSTKRNKVFNENNIWIDTFPVEVINYGGNEEAILMFELDKMEKLTMENDKKNKQ